MDDDERERLVATAKLADQQYQERIRYLENRLVEWQHVADLANEAQARLEAENARLRAVVEAARQLIRTNTTTDGPISLVAEVDHPAFQRLADALTALDVSGEGATDDDDAPFLRQHLAAAEAELHRTRAAQYTAEAERDRLRAVVGDAMDRLREMTDDLRDDGIHDVADDTAAVYRILAGAVDNRVQLDVSGDMGDDARRMMEDNDEA